MSGVEETTDQQLVDQVMAGNKNAFNLLVMRYQHRVAALIARFVQDPQEVEDVAQEAFIKAYRALPLFRVRQRILYLALPDRSEHRQKSSGCPQSQAACPRSGD